MPAQMGKSGLEFWPVSQALLVRKHAGLPWAHLAAMEMKKGLADIERELPDVEG